MRRKTKKDQQYAGTINPNWAGPGVLEVHFKPKRKIISRMDKNNFDVELIKQLVEQATESLTGQKVKIVIRKPVISSYGAHVYKTKGGDVIMDISPDLPIETFFHAWLHETGHVFRDHINQEREIFDFHTLPSGLLRLDDTPEEIEEYRRSPNELEAESFAEQIGNFAEREALKLFADSSILNRIRVLTRVQISKGA
jgi:hypothetical protein